MIRWQAKSRLRRGEFARRDVLDSKKPAATGAAGDSLANSLVWKA